MIEDQLWMLREAQKMMMKKKTKKTRRRRQLKLAGNAPNAVENSSFQRDYSMTAAAVVVVAVVVAA